MPLVAFKAIGYVEARRFSCGHHLSDTTPLARLYDRTWVISVTEPDEPRCPPVYAAEMLRPR